MIKKFKGGAVIAVLLIAFLAFSAPARAEMPVSWLGDLLAWYLEQNGVNITLLGPNTGINSDTTPGGDTSTPTLEVIAGYNAHLLYRPDGCGTVYDGHFGHLFFEPYGCEESTLHYMFTQWIFPVWANAPTPYAYTNGLAFGTMSGPAGGTLMIGEISWGVPPESLGSGNARMKITFDFYYDGWRYGGVINNFVEDSWIADPEDYEWIDPNGRVWLFYGTFSGLRSNFMGPITRAGYVNRGNGGNHVVNGNGCED